MKAMRKTVQRNLSTRKNSTQVAIEKHINWTLSKFKILCCHGSDAVKKINNPICLFKRVKDWNRYFSKENIQMINKHMKSCSTSLSTSQKQVKTIIWYHFTHSRVVIITMRTSVGKDVEKWKPSDAAREKLKHCGFFGNSLAIPQNLNMEVPYDTEDSLLRM